MKINYNNTIETPLCKSDGYIRIMYNRVLDQVYFTPCCSAFIHNYSQPISFDRDYFINNTDYCLELYRESDIKDLNKYYRGRCECVYPYMDLCKNYICNKNKLSIVDLAVYTMCNLKCKMCKFDHSYNKIEYELQLYLMDYLLNKKLDKILITTAGEPFLLKDKLFKFIENSKCDKIELITNATLLTKEDIFLLSNYKEKLIIAVSLDSIYKDTYEKIRIGSDFDVVFNNILLLKQYNLLDRINYVIQDLNLSEQFEVVQFFKKLDIKLSIMIDGNFDYTNKQALLNMDLIEKKSIDWI